MEGNLHASLLCIGSLLLFGQMALAEDNDKRFGAWKIVSAVVEDVQGTEAALRRTPQGLSDPSCQRAHDVTAGERWSKGAAIRRGEECRVPFDGGLFGEVQG